MKKLVTWYKFTFAFAVNAMLNLSINLFIHTRRSYGKKATK